MGTYICVYEWLSAVLEDADVVPSWSQPLLAGAAGGGLAWTVAFPMDVIKSRWQSKSWSIEKYRYRSLLHAARQIMNEEGPQVFHRGMGVAVFRGMVGYSFFSFGYAAARTMVF